jgi:hypothetical protein
MFTPRGQESGITEITGKNGENLSGDNVKSVSDVRIIEIVFPVDLALRKSRNPSTD